MFDFSPSGIVMALVLSVWTSLSSVAAAAIVGSVALALLAWTGLPVRARAVALGLAAGLGVFGMLWQGAEADGARRMMLHAHTLALQAERERVNKAEAITHDLAEQATRDLADARTDAANLRGLYDALAKDGRRDGVCVDRSLARRLRAL